MITSKATKTDLEEVLELIHTVLIMQRLS
ncbi:uncharacterized protein METZ01_LOCUS51916 [marine metagenome]|uniref:Uncharacterized protein n=1 Tax=marine metagenome TaxID=408172 RepID=A0A381S4P8_9ZZZZ